MISKTEEEKHESLKELLFQFAGNEIVQRAPDEKEKFYKRLEEIYYHPVKEERFRHFYSNIFFWLTEIDNSDDKNIDVLAANLYYLAVQYKACRNYMDGTDSRLINIQPELNKLFDHVNLDFARICYVKKCCQRTNWIK